MLKGIRRFFIAILAFFELIGSSVFDLPRTPLGEEIDMSKFTLTWSDEFDGNELDPSKWHGHFGGDSTAIVRRGGYSHSSLARVNNGSLFIEAKYLENGAGGGAPGYYSYLMDTSGLFEQKYGYFEVRCKLPKGQGLWSAFWMFASGVGNIDGSGRDGSEIDIFESPYFNETGRMHNAITSNIHFDGYGEAHQGTNVGKFTAKNPYDEFNTYGVEWNEKEYIFYINGVETSRSSFGGVSQVPEFLILSIEIDGDNGVPSSGWSGDIKANEFLPSQFEIDYVKAYQYNSLLGQ